MSAAELVDAHMVAISPINIKKRPSKILSDAMRIVNLLIDDVIQMCRRDKGVMKSTPAAIIACEELTRQLQDIPKPQPKRLRAVERALIAMKDTLQDALESSFRRNAKYNATFTTHLKTLETEAELLSENILQEGGKDGDSVPIVAKMKTVPPKYFKFETIEDYINAMKEDDPESIYQLAHVYEAGILTEKNINRAMELYKQAIQMNHSRSMVNLGYIYQFGVDDEVEPNLEKSYRLYSAACELKNPDAQNNIGYIHFTSNPPNYKEAFRLFKSAADQNCIPAFVHVAICYECGYGVHTDAKRAFQYYNKAAAHNVASAQYKVAIEYIQQKNYEEGVPLLRAAAEQDHAEAQFLMGRLHLNGTFLSPSDRQAFVWFFKASKLNHAQACCELGHMYYSGRGVGDGLLYDNSKAFYPDARKAYEKAAILGVADAMNCLGLFYEQGLGNTQVDYDLAREWYTKAANLEHADACFNLGLMHANGVGQPKDTLSAREMMNEACRLGSLAAKQWRSTYQ